MNKESAKSKCLTIILAGIFTTSIPAIANATDWTIKGLDGLETTFSHGYGINNSGQVAGESIGDAVFTSANGIGLTSLDFFLSYGKAVDINNSGQIVGSSSAYQNAPSLAFITTGPSGSGMTDLGTLGGFGSDATAINDAGQVVGTSDLNNQDRHGFITGPSGSGMIDLGTLGGAISEANGINNSGRVVGFADTTVPGVFHAFITETNGVDMRDLGTLGGPASIAYGINDSGQVVGMSFSSDGNAHSFITGPNGNGMTDLGLGQSEAYDINNSGQVIGSTGPSSGGFLYSDGVITNLSLLAPVMAAGWSNLSPHAINDSGQIVGDGTRNGLTQAFLLSPVPEPEIYVLLLAGLGLLGFTARQRKKSAK